MKRRVVVTGMDIVSSTGVGLDNFWQAVIQGKSGIKRIQSYDSSAYTTQIAGEVTDFSMDSLPEFANPKRYTRAVQYALFCAHHAILQAGLSKEELQKAGTFIGTSLGGHAEMDVVHEVFYQQSWRKIPPLTIIKAMPNAVSNHIAIAFGLGGVNSTVSNACVSSAEAIANACLQIRTGQLDVALCGGTESLIWESTMAAWCKLRVMSTQNEQPASACKPFDKNRDGLVMADGAGMLVLEDLEHAKSRGATIYAEILGTGASCDASHITVPETGGQVRAIEAALHNARVSPNDIHYINAHGTGTTLNDLTETNTIKTVFGEQAYSIPVTAQKSMTGHAIGAAAVMEIIATVMSLRHDILVPTINLHDPDPACDLDYVPNEARAKKIDLALSNHFAFGGANVALILRKYLA